jgi:MFS family permease
MLHGHSGWQTPFLFLWGMLVVMDSPQFSSLIAKYAPVENRGSALTIVTCIGFSITVISIIVLGMLVRMLGTTWLFWLLVPGPLFGVVALLGLKETKESA